MPYIQWRDELAVGIQTIDDQHRELVQRFNGFLQACRQQNHEEITRLFEFLHSYSIIHFESEEKVQLESGYPAITRHKRQHQFFIDKLKELKASLDQAGPSMDLIMSTNRFLVDWLIGHIGMEDRALAQYLQAKGISSFAG